MIVDADMNLIFDESVTLIMNGRYELVVDGYRNDMTSQNWRNPPDRKIRDGFYSRIRELVAAEDATGYTIEYVPYMRCRYGYTGEGEEFYDYDLGRYTTRPEYAITWEFDEGYTSWRYVRVPE